MALYHGIRDAYGRRGWIGLPSAMLSFCLSKTNAVRFLQLKTEDRLERLKDRIERLKKKRPGYGEVLDFYLKVREDQERIKGSLRMESISLKKDWKDLLTREGFPLLQRQDFPLDVEACINLFQSLCRIAEDAIPLMSEQVREIEKAITGRKLNLQELLVQ